jgi:hypothetical protein
MSMWLDVVLICPFNICSRCIIHKFPFPFPFGTREHSKRYRCSIRNNTSRAALFQKWCQGLQQIPGMCSEAARCENHPVPALEVKIRVGLGLHTILTTAILQLPFFGRSTLSQLTKTPQARKYSHSTGKSVPVLHLVQLVHSYDRGRASRHIRLRWPQVDRICACRR